MQAISWACSDTGQKRKNNEDSYLVDAGLGLFAVADGMGGHLGGARASELALQVLHRELAPITTRSIEETYGHLRLLHKCQWEEELAAQRDPLTPEFEEDGELATRFLKLVARRASYEVHREASMNRQLEGMGTTMTAALFREGRVHLVHAGDSRAYLFRDGKLRQLTNDHSYVAEQMRLGRMSTEQAETSQLRHVITRSIGYQSDVEADTWTLLVQTGDCLLMCSDGLTNLVCDDELEATLRSEWFSEAPQVLVDRANDNGGDDNITVLVAYAPNHLGAHNPVVQGGAC